MKSSRHGHVVSLPRPAPPPFDAVGASPIDPLALYAGGIDTSDYVAGVGGALRRLIPSVGDLLDLGAGGGQLGAALRQQGRRWTAVEPSASMRDRLARLDPAPEIVAAGWENASVAPADTVLAANMPAPLTEPASFLARCRNLARRRVVWVVPAQNGPRGLCLAGCLPREWHGEDETPGVDIVMAGLAPADRTPVTAEIGWTFSLIVSDLPRLAAYLAGRLGWPEADPRRPVLFNHLAAQARPEQGVLRLSVPRRSAILIWSLT
ncbi:methyltransferase domain-containing protein [Methylopila henanensis]|uniref:Methyltransferase domain-containing protein n=1 Tax=Methylopila henanensis TaxID=873516 RepID=A0ABW4K8U6_9HYPH